MTTTDQATEAHNASLAPRHEAAFQSLAEGLSAAGHEVDGLVKRIGAFGVAVPSWGVGTGGTRFARFPGDGEPRHIFDKLDDCAVINALSRATPSVSLHFPWDTPDDATALRDYAADLGIVFDAVNSNTFQDQPGQKLSYKFGSLTHTDAAVRQQAIDHNLACIETGKAIGSKALTVWIGDGSNFPGQAHFTGTFERYLESMRAIYGALPTDWRLLLEHKIHEPAFYSTVIQDWGSSYLAANELGEQAQCLVDLGHHAPTVNIEMIVARLIQFGKLGGFHFNDSKYGDDDLDAGLINPYQLFLVCNELVDAETNHPERLGRPAYMLDQSHNVTDPIESLMISAVEVQRAYAQALLVDRPRLAACQEANDALMASETLKTAFRTDVSSLLAEARRLRGGAIDPVGAYRASGYRARVARDRPAIAQGSSGIV